MNYNKVKKYYDNKLWSKKKVKNAVGKWITSEEYELITGDEFVMIVGD